MNKLLFYLAFLSFASFVHSSTKTYSKPLVKMAQDEIKYKNVNEENVSEDVLIILEIPIDPLTGKLKRDQILGWPEETLSVEPFSYARFNESDENLIVRLYRDEIDEAVAAYISKRRNDLKK